MHELALLFAIIKRLQPDIRARIVLHRPANHPRFARQQTRIPLQHRIRMIPARHPVIDQPVATNERSGHRISR